MDVFEISDVIVRQYADHVLNSLKITDERLRSWLYDQAQCLGKRISSYEDVYI